MISNSVDGVGRKWGDKLKKDILVQYSDLKEEMKDIRRRIEKTQDRLNRMKQGGTVIDSVTGTRPDGTFGHIRIEGFPFANYDRQQTQLYLYLAQMTNMEAELLELTNSVEEYINSINDSRMRRIIQYRIIDGLSWYEVADRMGGKATSDSCKKYFERFMKND